MAKSIDHSRLIHECLGQHRQAVVKTETTPTPMVAQRYSKRVSPQSTPTLPEKAYCVWQDELGHQYDHLSIDSLQFVRAL